MYIRKKNFVLFEVLIAFSLVAISVFPFLHYPYQHVRKQIEFLYEMELQRIGGAELAKWEVALYQNQEGLEERIFAKKKCQKNLDKENSVVNVKLFNGINKIFYRKLKIYQSGRKKTQDGKIFSLVNIEVEYFNRKRDKKPVFKAKTQLVAQKKD